MASGACSSFQVCDSVSGTGSFQNLPESVTDTYTHHMYRGGPEIESTKVERWKTFLWLYKSGRARGRVRKNSLETFIKS